MIHVLILLKRKIRTEVYRYCSVIRWGQMISDEEFELLTLILK